MRRPTLRRAPASPPPHASAGRLSSSSCLPPSAPPAPVQAQKRERPSCGLSQGVGVFRARSSAPQEVEKLQWSTIWGADTVMDLSTGEGVAKEPVSARLCSCSMVAPNHV